MPELYSNDPSTTLNGTISAGDTALIVTSAIGFPGSGNFRIRVDNELMIVTAVSSNTFTITRGAEGTSAASHTTGVTVNHFLTAGGLTAVLADSSLFGVNSALPSPSGYRSGDRYKATNCPIEYIHDGTAWRAYRDGFQITLPLAADWTLVNQAGGIGTKADVLGSVVLDHPAANDYMTALLRTIPTAPYTRTLCLNATSHNSNGNDLVCGILLTEGLSPTTSKQLMFRTYTTNLQTMSQTAYNRTGETNLKFTQFMHGAPNKVWWRIEDNNTNHIFSYSIDGMNFVIFDTRARTSVVTATHYGFFMMLLGSNSAGVVTLISET